MTENTPTTITGLERLLTLARAERDRLDAALQQALERERIISETYNGQQQSYRELEALYQASQARALSAEADAAALKEALIARHTCETCGGKGSYWVDNDGEAEHEVCDCWIEADEALKQKHAGAELLAELLASRPIIKTLRLYHDAGGEVWRSIDADLADYDVAVKARAE